MTEAEWLACTDPQKMLEFLRGKVSDRKLQLFSVGTLRSIGVTSREAHIRAEVAERLAEGLTTSAEVRRYWGEQSAWPERPWEWATSLTSGEDGAYTPWAAPREMVQLLSDIFGNLFRPVTVDTAWQTSAVVALARSIYDERRFADLPVLADALEEAGCTNAESLSHCRGQGPHVRGCWALDLLLGKS